MRVCASHSIRERSRRQARRPPLNRDVKIKITPIRCIVAECNGSSDGDRPKGLTKNTNEFSSNSLQVNLRVLGESQSDRLT